MSDNEKDAAVEERIMPLLGEARRIASEEGVGLWALLQIGDGCGHWNKLVQVEPDDATDATRHRYQVCLQTTLGGTVAEINERLARLVGGAPSMIGNTVIGSCSRCGGDVVQPELWAGVQAPRSKCSTCGAVSAGSPKPVIEMVPPERLADADALAERFRGVPFVIKAPAALDGAVYADSLPHVGPEKSGSLRPWKKGPK